jgi:hypothetical protein
MKRRFFFHFNKPESKKQDRNVLTVHWRGNCIPVNSIDCQVATETHDRNSQPTCVVRGWASDVEIEQKDKTTKAIIK